MCKDTNEFKKFLEKYKCFRELPEQYKTDKFILLYSKIYKYALNIPKEKIMNIKAKKSNGNLLRLLFVYINHFIEAKDFYHWKDRVYNLITKKIGSCDFQKFELYYRSKAKEFFNNLCNNIITNSINTKLIRFGKENNSQTEEWKEKVKATSLERYGKEYYFQTEECKEKIKSTNLEKHGKEWYTQTEEMKEQSKATCMKNLGVEYPLQSKEVQEKHKATCMKKYNVEWYLSSSDCKKNSNNHSKSADNICTILDNVFSNPEDSRYAIKNGEFILYYNSKKNYYAYDYCIPSKKLIVEIDDPYWHALDKDDNEIIKLPGNKLILAKDIHKRDKEKEELAIKAGYKVFHIRDDEYKKDPKDVIEKLLEQIKEYINSKNI